MKHITDRNTKASYEANRKIRNTWGISPATKVLESKDKRTESADDRYADWLEYEYDEVFC